MVPEKPPVRQLAKLVEPPPQDEAISKEKELELMLKEKEMELMRIKK